MPSVSAADRGLKTPKKTDSHSKKKSSSKNRVAHDDTDEEDGGYLSGRHESVKKHRRDNVQNQLKSQLAEARQGYHRSQAAASLHSSNGSNPERSKGELILRELKSNTGLEESPEKMDKLVSRCGKAEEELAILSQKRDAEEAQRKQLQAERIL